MEEKFIKIDCDFVEKGLTLEEAFILGRVKSFEEEGSPYYESNETIAKMIGKSKSTVKNSINALVEKGYIRKEIRKRSRLLSISDGVKYCHNIGVKEKPNIGVKNEQNEERSLAESMTAEERAQYLEEYMSRNRDPNYDGTELF